MKLDVTDEESMTSAVDKIIAEQGTIHILVNNAGYGSYGALEDVPLSEGKYQFEVNVFGLARLTQLVLPHMRQNSYGKIINVSSIGGKIYEPMGSWYHATKFAVEGMSDCLRLELKELGIDVIIIEPGAIKTEWGGIASQKVLEVSGNTAYKKHAQQTAKMLSTSKFGSDSDVIAKTIEKSILARKPKARYVAGDGAAFMVFLRKISCHGFMDRALTFIFRQSAK